MWGNRSIQIPQQEAATFSDTNVLLAGSCAKNIFKRKLFNTVTTSVFPWYEISTSHEFYNVICIKLYLTVLYKADIPSCAVPDFTFHFNNNNNNIKMQYNNNNVCRMLQSIFKK